jgi:4-hydroxybenzoate polyprenyltransferase
VHLRPILELIRFPAVCTAPADVLCGLAIAGVLSAELTSLPVALLLVASMCMYAAGMAANDVFDLEVDREERPERPLPSGRVEGHVAWVLVLGLQVIALALSYSVGFESMACVAGTIGATYLYNAGGKNTVLGPFIMGACRYGNALVGLSIIPLSTVPTWSFMVPATIALYVTALTFVSGYEVGGSDAPGRRVAISCTLLASLSPLLIVFLGDFVPATAFVVVALPPLWLASAAKNAYRAEGDGATRAFVLRSIHGIVVMNAVVAGLVGHFMLATVIAVLLIPARLVGRWFYST